MWLPLLFGVLAASHVTSVAAAAQPAPATPATYRVISLGSGGASEKPVINAKGQVAISMDFGYGYSNAMFYDGKTVQNLGNLGGSHAFAVGLNDNGQVTGYSVDATDATFHAFAWDKGTGMIDLGTLPGERRSMALANNNRGTVVGVAGSAAVRWTLARGLESLGTLGGRFASATAVNDAGLIAGWGEPAGSTDTVHAFVWTAETGMTDIHPPARGGFSFPLALGGGGQVTGWTEFSGADQHAFLWTPEGGMRDIAAATLPGTRSLGLAISRNGQHVAGLLIPHAMAWSEATGMVDLGTFGGSNSRSFDVNNQGQVVGSADTSTGRARAFVWTAADGMVDLNDRLRDAPPGLELESAVAVSETGAIVAYSNLGLMLLKPDGDDAGESAAATQQGPSLAMPLQLGSDAGQRAAAPPLPSRDACIALDQGAKMFALFGAGSAIECVNARTSP